MVCPSRVRGILSGTKSYKEIAMDMELAVVVVMREDGRLVVFDALMRFRRFRRTSGYRESVVNNA